MCAGPLPSRNFGWMRAPDDFDAFYKDARSRLLLQAYALTGDLPASRSAVRDAFIVAWHHWRKVSRLDDPESSVRPHAWAHAQRRHTARVWHRDKSLDPDVRATLDALGKLSITQRKVLLLTLLTTGSMADIARELGLPRDDAERELQTATARYAMARDIAVHRCPRHAGAAARPRRRRTAGRGPRSSGGPGPPDGVPTPRWACSARWPPLVVSGLLVTQGGDVRPGPRRPRRSNGCSRPRARSPAPPQP